MKRLLALILAASMMLCFASCEDEGKTSEQGSAESTNTEPEPTVKSEEYVEQQRDYRYIIKEDGKYGYINYEGEVVIEPQFDKAKDFSEGLAYVEKDGKEFFVDVNGATAFELDFKYVEDKAGDFNGGLVAVREDYKWGFMDKKGNYVIKPQYDDVHHTYYCGKDGFNEGLAAVCVEDSKTGEGKWGFIDKKGNMVIKPKFDWIGLCGFSEGLCAVGENNLYGFINQKGEYVIEPKYVYVDDFSEGVAFVNEKKGEEYDRKFIDKNGKTVIGDLPSGYTCHFKEGVARCLNENNKELVVIDTKGKVLVEANYEYALPHYSDGLLLVTEKKSGRKYGYIDKEGNVVIPFEFLTPAYGTKAFKNGLAHVVKVDKSGYINTKGEWVYIENK